jgi:hypothetical protein
MSSDGQAPDWFRRCSGAVAPVCCYHPQETLPRLGPLTHGVHRKWRVSLLDSCPRRSPRMRIAPQHCATHLAAGSRFSTTTE